MSDPAWFGPACHILNAGFTKSAALEGGQEMTKEQIAHLNYTEAMMRYAMQNAAPQPSCCSGIGGCEMKAAIAEITRLRAELATARREGVEGFGDLVDAAYAEAAKAIHKFPQPNYVISKIAEEAGELVKAAIHCAEKRETAENVAGEMKQLIAMLIRLWVEGDQVHGLPPIAAAIRAAAGEVK